MHVVRVLRAMRVIRVARAMRAVRAMDACGARRAWRTCSAGSGLEVMHVTPAILDAGDAHDARRARGA
eukprot:1814476-Lingulodinium_polyedra.AAC.1